MILGCGDDDARTITGTGTHALMSLQFQYFECRYGMKQDLLDGVLLAGDVGVVTDVHEDGVLVQVRTHVCVHSCCCHPIPSHCLRSLLDLDDSPGSPVLFMCLFVYLLVLLLLLFLGLVVPM